MTSMHRRQALAQLTAGAGALALPGWATAQSATSAARWPVTPIKWMVPAPAGGGVDVLCRQLAERISTVLGTTIIIENKAGAGGLLGVKALAMSPANGSNIGYVHSGLVSVQALGAKLNLLTELKPVVGRLQASAFVVVVHADSPYQTMGDLMKAMAAQPDKLSYGHGGAGSPAHIVFEKIKAARPELSATAIPYKGAIEGVTALMGKGIDFMVGVMSAVLTPLKAGRFRALAVSSPARSRLLPDVPTLAESGLPGLAHVSWSGVFAPAGMSDELVSQLRIATVKVAADPDFIAFVSSLGGEMLPHETPKAFEDFLKASIASETALMKKLGLVT